MVKHKDIPKLPAVIFDTKPICMLMEPGKYFWCACGRSKNHPWCDGSHYQTGIRPIRIVIDEKREVCWCACKQTQTPPFCDNSHIGLKKR